MLDYIKLKNFKCFEQLYVELSNLNVLAGINSMGKSSVIQAILLLRQTFDMGMIHEGLHLNGELTQMGAGYDLLNRDSDEDQVELRLGVDDDELFWSYDYSKDSDYQKIRETNSISADMNRINIFTPNFCYISADRLGPRKYYRQSYHEIHDKNQLGKRGELSADYLAKRGREDRVENRSVLFEGQKSELLLNQTEAWLSVISPGVHIDYREYQEAGIVGLEYKVNHSEYSPVNIGFGISHVLPVIIGILKAKKDDLLIIENPEAHLHPKGQRKMGEMIARAASGGVLIILETHSDHILNGIRLSVKKNIIHRNYVRLNYFYQRIERNYTLGEKIIHDKCSPAILEDGSLSDWPDGFFDEWDKALFELL